MSLMLPRGRGQLCYVTDNEVQRSDHGLTAPTAMQPGHPGWPSQRAKSDVNFSQIHFFSVFSLRAIEVTPHAFGWPSFSTAVPGSLGIGSRLQWLLHLQSGWMSFISICSGSRLRVSAVAYGVLRLLSLRTVPRDTYRPCQQLRPHSLAQNTVWGVPWLGLAGELPSAVKADLLLNTS